MLVFQRLPEIIVAVPDRLDASPEAVAGNPILIPQGFAAHVHPRVRGAQDKHVHGVRRQVIEIPDRQRPVLLLEYHHLVDQHPENEKYGEEGDAFQASFYDFSESPHFAVSLSLIRPSFPAVRTGSR